MMLHSDKFTVPDDEDDQPDRTCPPPWVLDKIADEKLTGGFDMRRSNQCKTCFQARSVNNACGCP